ncbi:pectate lyase [Marinicrinis lubricantis]|uniref:Pectate lyase n=1 Tax=Marinicrinis lubricantis TaxID=2086470 RepID=A0ABW1IVS9_9BACL
MRKPMKIMAAWLVGWLILFVTMMEVSASEEYKPNPVPYLKAGYVTGNLQQDIRIADQLITWQLEHGGWNKNAEETFISRPWNGEEDKSTWKNASGEPLGTIDNNATNDEILFLAMIYKETGEVRYKDAAVRGIDFLLKMQYETGGWPQVFPASGGYSDHATFNDSAMIRTMNVLRLYAEQQYPFNSDITDKERIRYAKEALGKGLDFILKSQIVVDGYPTAWCAQHDPYTYEPVKARDYEHPSISGAESAAIVNYLISIPNPTEEVKKSIVGAIRWFDKVKLDGFTYVSGDPKGAYFYYNPDSVTWYRFYDIETFEPIFSGRDGVIHHNIHQIEKERRDGYRWAGDWGNDLLKKIKELSYFKDVSYQLDVDRFSLLQQKQENRGEQITGTTDAEMSQPDSVSIALDAEDVLADTDGETSGSKRGTGIWRWLYPVFTAGLGGILFGLGAAFGKGKFRGK